MHKISLVVPCYNEQEALPLFYAEANRITKEMPQAAFEFVFVNDGSRDATLDVMRTLAEPSLTAISGEPAKFYVGGEYRYSNYESDFSRNQIVATVGYRF